MGFDPMTHRPRTDIFSSLPHLIALANLKELMEQNSWEKQAVRLQNEAAQMAKLQYLQYLLQPPPSMATFSNNISPSAIPDMEAFNLLNSLSTMKDSPLLDTSIPSSLMAHNNSTLHAVHDSIPFSHLPDLESCLSKDMVHCSNFTALCSQGENSPTSPWLPSNLSPSSPPAIPPMTTEVSVTNTGDACSTSSYEGGPSSSIWPELLLDDPLFHDIA